MTTWKTLLALLLLVLLAAMLYPTRTPAPTTAGKTRIVYWGSLQASEAVRTAVEEFQTLHPEYYVEIGNAAHRESIGDNTRFLLSVAGGEPPDIMLINRLTAIEMAARDSVTDLTPFLEADKSRPDGVRQEDYFSSLWDETCYQGRQYCIANQANVRTLYLNDDALIRAGFTDDMKKPRPPKSWEDICRKKFHGTGTVNSSGLVRLNLASTQHAALRTQNVAQVDDVVTLRSGRTLFRARIGKVHPDGSFAIDFSRELSPEIKSVPAALASAKDLEIKIFDARSYTVALTRFDERGNIAVLGFTPLGGNSWLLNFAWQNGTDVLSPDGRTALLDDPRNREALQFMVDCCDSMGGYVVTKTFEESQLRGDERSPFVTGKMAMIINGSWFLNYLAIFKNDFRFTCVPPPLPEKRIAEGAKPFTWIGGAGLVIPAEARNPRGGWELLRFLASARGRRIQYEVDWERNRAAGQLFVPDLPCRKDMLEDVKRIYLTSNPSLSQSVREGFEASAKLLPYAMYRVPTPVSNRMFEIQVSAGESAMGHLAPVADVLANKDTELQESIDRYYDPPSGPRVIWTYLIGGYVALLGLCAALLVRREVRRRNAGFGRRDWRAGFACVSPWLVGFIVFGGGPMLFSLVISFCHYDILHPARFVGFDNYIALLGFHTNALGQFVPNDPKLWKSLANTAFMLIGLPLSITLGLLLAMLLAAQIRGIAVFRTLFYLPHIIPAVASFLLWFWIFDPRRGLLNTALFSVGVNHPPAWLWADQWAKPAIILMGLWGVGGGMLIWLAGLKAIPVQLYEAAEIDGAGPLRKFFNVTLPMLSPYIFFNTVMGIIGTLQVFEAAFIMTEGGPNDSTLFYAYYLFNQAFRYLDMGAASAMAWILFLLVFSLTLLQLWISRKWVHYD